MQNTDNSSFDDPANATQGVTGSLGTSSQYVSGSAAEEDKDAAVATFKMFLNILIGVALPWLIIVFGIFVLIGRGITKVGNDYVAPEIGLSQYDEISEYSDSFPGLKDTVKKLLVNDGVIDEEEFISIKNVKSKLRKEEKRKRLLRDVSE